MLLEELIQLLERKIVPDELLAGKCGDIIASDVRDRDFLKDMNKLFTSTPTVRGTYNTKTHVAYFWNGVFCNHALAKKFIKTDKIADTPVSNEENMIDFHLSLLKQLESSQVDTDDYHPKKIKFAGNVYYLVIQNTKKNKTEEEMNRYKEEIAGFF